MFSGCDLLPLKPEVGSRSLTLPWLHSSSDVAAACGPPFHHPGGPLSGILGLSSSQREGPPHMCFVTSTWDSFAQGPLAKTRMEGGGRDLPPGGEMSEAPATWRVHVTQDGKCLVWLSLYPVPHVRWTRHSAGVSCVFQPLFKDHLRVAGAVCHVQHSGSAGPDFLSVICISFQGMVQMVYWRDRSLPLVDLSMGRAPWGEPVLVCFTEGHAPPAPRGLRKHSLGLPYIFRCL